MVQTGDDIQERLTNLGVNILQLCDSLPRSLSNHHIGQQLRRSGTSPAANYAEARAAESRRDFAHKLGIVFKELRESSVWLAMIAKKFPPSSIAVERLQNETTELSKIVAVSLRTLRKNQEPG
jgi:four helix bundle protein